MRIIGPDELIFGIDDMESCRTYLADYGLGEVALPDEGYRFQACDGTAMTMRWRDDPALPPPLASGNMLRQTIWGCVDQETVETIAADLGRDRKVIRQPDGSIWTTDDVGFQIAFRVTRRRPMDRLAERINSPGALAGRSANEIGADEAADARPLTLSHVVYFTPDQARMEAFYVDRLGFTVTDRFTNLGPFLRPQASDDHHCLFMLATPSHMQGLEHVAFHMQGPTALMLAGHRMVAKGYESFWGPGRHKFGSNWFWYLNSPMGVHVEYDADMDKLDDAWAAREVAISPDTAQMFLLENVQKWAPGGGSSHH